MHSPNELEFKGKLSLTLCSCPYRSSGRIRFPLSPTSANACSILLLSRSFSFRRRLTALCRGGKVIAASICIFKRKYRMRAACPLLTFKVSATSFQSIYVHLVYGGLLNLGCSYRSKVKLPEDGVQELCDMAFSRHGTTASCTSHTQV